MKSYDDHLLRITYDEKGGAYRLAKVYIWRTLPSGKRLIYAQFNNRYICHLPNHIYNQYMGRRKRAMRLAIRNLKKGDDTNEER